MATATAEEEVRQEEACHLNAWKTYLIVLITVAIDVKMYGSDFDEKKSYFKIMKLSSSSERHWGLVHYHYFKLEL